MKKSEIKKINAEYFKNLNAKYADRANWGSCAKCGGEYFLLREISAEHDELCESCFLPF